MSHSFSMYKMFRIIEVGEHLVVELPYLKEQPDTFFSALGIPKQPILFELRFRGELVASGTIGDDARIAVRMQDRPAGAYEVRLAVAESEGRDIWKQLVYVQPKLSRSPKQIDELARRHAPIFLFSHKEEYFPVSLGELLNAQELVASGQTVQVNTIFGDQEVPVSALAEFLRYNGHSDYLLNQSGMGLRSSDYRKVHGSAGSSVVYYSYMEDPANNRFFINYHTFYTFDPKTGIAKMLNVGPHIFDRESMTVVFDTSERPQKVVVSGHLENQTISFFDKLMAWSSGRVVYASDHPRAPQVQGHPIVPVAEGSHALYPAAGRYQISVLTELAGHVLRQFLPHASEEDDPPELHNRQVLLPPALTSAQYSSYELRPLRLDRLTSDPAPAQDLFDPDTSVLTFSGYWVDVPGLHNERFPPFSKKECEIEEWVDRAFAWKWDELPEDVARHNEAVTAAIAARVHPR